MKGTQLKFTSAAIFAGLALLLAPVSATLVPSTLMELPPDDFRISDVGVDGDTADFATNGKVAHNATDNEYLVIWIGTEDTTGGSAEEWEIYGQIFDVDGNPLTGEFRISDMGPDGDASFDTFDPEVVWNSTNNEYLAVWAGDDNTGALVDGEFEIYGQRISADGAEIGTNDFRISTTGVDGDATLDAFDPALAYNATDNEYLVTWDAGQAVGNVEIFGQRLAGATGAEVGTDDFQISDTSAGPAGIIGAIFSAIAWNSAENEYLVVWESDVFGAGEEEVFGRLIDNTGAQISPSDFRISAMGPDGDASFGGFLPDVAYGSALNEYLVVFVGDDNTGGLVDGQLQIYGQRISAAGAEVGTDDFRISNQPPGDTVQSSFDAEVVYNDTFDEYLVIWEQRDPDPVNSTDDFENYVARIEANGDSTGQAPFRISMMGPDTDDRFDGFSPDVAWNSVNNEYLAVWEGDDNIAPLVEDEFEIFGQLLGFDLDADSAVVNWAEYE